MLVEGVLDQPPLRYLLTAWGGWRLRAGRVEDGGLLVRNEFKTETTSENSSDVEVSRCPSGDSRYLQTCLVTSSPTRLMTADTIISMVGQVETDQTVGGGGAASTGRRGNSCITLTGCVALCQHNVVQMV